MEPADYQPFAPDVHAFVDGRMDAESERDFRRRMNASDALRRQVEQLRGALAVLHGLPGTEPPADFKDKLIGRIREEDLAERARKRISVSPTPLWQHFVHAATGAVAAALLLAFFGLPALWEGAAPERDDTLALSALPVEEDLLPVLGDQYERFDSLRRQVNAVALRGADEQRQLLRIELESSGLSRRNAWLASEVAGLPPDRGLQYSRFLESLDAALFVLGDEVARREPLVRTAAGSLDARAVDMARVRAALDAVETPELLRGGYRIAASSTLPDLSGNVTAGGSDELQLYAGLRRAEYRHDPQAMLSAAEEFLARRRHGAMADHARVAKVAALLRLGRDLEAARYLRAEFSEFDEELSPATRAMLQACFKPEEALRLQKAQQALMGE